MCTPRHILASAAVSRDGALPPLWPSACTEVPVRPWVFCPSQVPSRLCVPASPSPSSTPNPEIIRSLAYCQVGFRVRARGQGASTSWQSRSLVLASPATWPCRRRSGYPDPPPPFPPLPPSRFMHYIIPVSRISVGSSARIRCCARM